MTGNVIIFGFGAVIYVVLNRAERHLFCGGISWYYWNSEVISEVSHNPRSL